ncbi:interleukin-17 receptor C [Rana temporaria]|uniref:interleukin-17 receptor C n=1 Tax=Rana temporaria TaxID=8407 RepID=UPI001AAC73A3|nr:interleukin-17 receptor C [Rana temporaria]
MTRVTRVTSFGVLLVHVLLYGLSTQDRGALRTLPHDGGAISCSGDLVCEQSEMLCLPGNMETAMTPVLVPSDLRAETVKKCHNDNCSLCVRVTVEISAAFLTEHNEELGSGDCDDYGPEYDDFDDYDREHDEDEENAEITAVNVYLKLNNSNNGSLLCANLIIAPPTLSCYAMKVSLPLSAVPPTNSSSSTVVGSVAYNCIKVSPGAEMNITSYSYPRYTKILSISHEVPGCTKLDPLDNIWVCDAPVLDFVNESNETSVGIVNGSNRRKAFVRVFYYNYKKNITHSNNTLIGEKRYYIPQSDIVPCMCIQAWYIDLVDAMRYMLCPFRNYPKDLILDKSKLEVKIDKLTSYTHYTLNAPCEVTAEASLCWKSGNPPRCREIPNTRSKVVSQIPYRIKDLEVPHPSLCVQVSVKGKVLHTECLNASVRREFQNEALLCLIERGRCKTLFNMTHQPKIDLAFLEEKLVGDALSDHCIKVLSSAKQNISVCSIDKFMRSRWTWSRVLCLLVVACVLLIILLKVEDLKKWLKSVTAEKPLDEIFKNRRVLILYSPDDPAYEELVRVFSFSLKVELKLDVILDQWDRTEMARVGPLPWYQKQKSDVFEKGGLIILLFSEGARDRYTAWKGQRAEQVVESDPYGSFGAILNCVYPDFLKGRAKGRYLVASFGSNNDVVPDPFGLLPIYTLPLNLIKLLPELAGDNRKILRRKHAKRLSVKISNSLQEPLKACQKTMNRQTVISQDGSELSESPRFDEKVAMELEPLV